MRQVEICRVKDNIGYRIRKLRESKDYNQENMAGELGISISAYSKIERGVTDPSVGRIISIAKILGVEVSYFFNETSAVIMEEPGSSYGYATKQDIAALMSIINTMKNDIRKLRNVKSVQAGKQKKK